MKKVVALAVALGVTFMTFGGVALAKGSGEAKAGGQKQAIGTALKSRQETVRSLQQQGADLQKQLEAAAAANKALVTQAKTAKPTLSDQDAAKLKDARQKAAELQQKMTAAKQAKAQVRGLRQQEQALQSEIKSLRTGLKADQENVKQAIKNRDQVGAEAALDKAIAAGQQVLEKGRQLLALQQQIGTILKGLLNQ